MTRMNTAAKSVESLGVRTRAMGRKLRDVEMLPDDAAQILLGSGAAADEEDDVATTVDLEPGLAAQ